MPLTKQAVLFDLDDTLYPERTYVLSGFQAVAKWAEARLGLSETATARELTAYFEMGVRGQTFNRWLHDRGLDSQADHLIPEMLTVYREHDPVLKPFDGIVSALETLAPVCRLGIVSDGYLSVQLKKWQALGLQPFFTTVLFSDVLGRDAWKPSPLPFRKALERLGVAPDRAVYVGDNPAKDFLGARRAGLRSLRVRMLQGEHCHQEPASQAHAPDVTITGLEALLPAIGALLSEARFLLDRPDSLVR